MQVIIVVLIIGAPFLNVLLLAALYVYVGIYIRRLSVFETNKRCVPDPFKNMVYDPQICHSLHRDHYFFEVELKGTSGCIFRTRGFHVQLQRRDEEGAEPAQGAR